MRQNLMLIVQLDPEHRPRQNGRNGALNLNRFLAAHAVGGRPKEAMSFKRRPFTSGDHVDPVQTLAAAAQSASSLPGTRTSILCQTNHVLLPIITGKIPRRVYHAWKIGNPPSRSNLSCFIPKARIFWSSLIYPRVTLTFGARRLV